jgi:general secretion pathway protein D
MAAVAGPLRLALIGLLLTLLASPTAASDRAGAPTSELRAQGGGTPPAVVAPPVVLNFEQADIEAVIRAASEIVGFNYVVEPDVKSKRITVMSPGGIRHHDIFRTLLAILEVHGVTAVESENLYKFVRLPGTPGRPLPIVVGSTPAPGRADDEVITQIVPLARASVADLHAVLRPLVPAAGSILAHPERNVLVLVDSVANIRRLLGLVNLLDASPLGSGDVHVIPVKFADAQELAAVVTRVVARDEHPPLVVAHRGSNALLVRGTVSQVESIRRQVAALDGEVSGGPRVFFYFPEHVKAAELAAVMNAVGVDETPLRFVADERANAVIVATSRQRWLEIEETLKGLDREPRQVVVEALAVEVTQSTDRTFDVAWAAKSGSVSVVQTPSADVLALAAGLLGGASSVSPSPIPGLTALLVDTDRLLAFLRAVATEARIDVLSSTRIATLEGKKAVINVSESVPVVTGAPSTAPPGDQVSSILTQSVQYRDVGVILTVTPRIGDGGTVALEFKHTLDDIGERDPTLGLLTFVRREAENSVVLTNHQTLVMGGLVQDRRSRTRAGVPFLSKIPVLGVLFTGHDSAVRQKREILILVTPHVVGSPAAASRTPAERSGPSALSAGPKIPAPPR